MTRPLLSDDGRLLGYVGEGDVYVVRDLVTGHRTVFAQLLPRRKRQRPGAVQRQPVPERLLLPRRPLPRVGGRGQRRRLADLRARYPHRPNAELAGLDLLDTVLAGWQTNDRLVLSGLEPGQPQQLTTRDLDGHTLATVAVQSPSGADVAVYGAAATLTPDRTAVALLVDATQVTRYSLATGTATGRFDQASHGCPLLVDGYQRCRHCGRHRSPLGTGRRRARRRGQPQDDHHQARLWRQRTVPAVRARRGPRLGARASVARPR